MLLFSELCTPDAVRNGLCLYVNLSLQHEVKESNIKFSFCILYSDTVLLFEKTKYK